MSTPTSNQNIQNAATQVTGAVNQLNQLYARKETLSEELENVNQSIRALRNLMNGVDLGQRLASEVLAERAAEIAKK